ncbi:hypothetical protein PTKIN_Ptkin01aG0017000 [Pterospermum kingtungense]
MGIDSGARLMEFLTLVILLTAATTKVSAIQPKPGCQTKCGNVSVPYPFGTETGCYMAGKFFIKCNTTFDPPRPFFRNTPMEVLDINLDGQFRIRSPIASDCYPSTDHSHSDVGFKSATHHISPTRNKFIAVGFDTLALIQGYNGVNYATGCLSLCNNISDVINGTCSGIACCRADIPKGVKAYNISLASYLSHKLISGFNPCSYAFIAEDGAYNFSISDLHDRGLASRRVPMVLDWRIGKLNCSEAQKDPENYACQENTICENPEYGHGYLCKCSDGFEGNPYLYNGCQDINECETLNPCNSTCHNTFGGFHCSCPDGYEGDGRRGGTGCYPKRSNRLQIVIGMIIGSLALSLCIMSMYLVYRKIKKIRLRESYFKQNGGLLLREQLLKQEGYGEYVKLFAAEELEKVTNNYHESRIIGQGGQGTVYKGILDDNQMVAIKKSRIGDSSQVQSFINEIIVLCQINHRNVVKLLGCCFETPVPMLVYEYVSNGTLFDHLHEAGDDACSFLPWKTRLRIATETAETLSYLHSAASVPIVHRDIKLANILLDENYTAKVSDFGASRLIPTDASEVATVVQGTFGYLDPEYMHTSLLTEKSDVYSFGVVLIELLTGQKVVCFKRSDEKRVLAKYFVSLMEEDRLLEILDPRVVNDGNFEQLKEVSALAAQCVAIKGDERPSMKQVAHELTGLLARNVKTFPSDEGRVLSVLTAFDVDVVSELVPLEGDEEGAGSFLGSICSQYSLGNLDASDERTVKARIVKKNKHLCFQETNMFAC